MNVYLDDVKGLPFGNPLGNGSWDDTEGSTGKKWEVVRTVSTCVDLLAAHKGDVQVLSLDYSLEHTDCGTGLDVLEWLADHRDCLPDFIRIHSDHWLAPTLRRKSQALMASR